MKYCRVVGERWGHREHRAMAALALRWQFDVEGDVLDRVEVFRYLDWLLLY